MPPRAPFLRDYQARTLRALLRGLAIHRGATFTVMYPRQAGKNETAAALVDCLLRTNAGRGGTVVVCAPTLHPQADISFARLRDALAATEPLFPEAGRTRISGATISVGRASAVFLSASPAAHVAGHTASLALIADEAQDIDSDWFNRQFRPMAASTGASTVLFGTAWDGRSLLEEAAAQNRERVAAQHGRPYLDWLPFHHQVEWREVAAANPRYGEYVRSERRRLGANHPLFLSQYELIAAEAAGRLLSAGQLALIEGDHPRLYGPVPGERYVGGLDFGGEGPGADATVLTIARLDGQDCQVVAHVAWRGLPYGTVVREVVAIARQWRFERLTADATGLGGPLVAAITSDLGPRIESFTFTAQSKTSLGYALIAAANTHSLSLYADDGSAEAAACREELRECRAQLRGEGQLAWAAPPGAHDDFVVSLALCLHAARSAGTPRVARGR
jgi:hypothetical protein